MSPRILVVEDDKAFARAVSRMLETSGYTVAAVASSGAEAIRKAAELRPDLVLMDISLRGPMDGADAASHIHREFDLPVIYLTGQADAATLDRAKEAQPYGYLLKPVSAQDLHSAITMALHNAQIRRDQQPRPLAAMTAQNVFARAEEAQVWSEHEEDGAEMLAKAAEDLWQATVNYFERWTAYDDAVLAGESDRQGSPLEEAVQTLVLLAENELRHTTEVFRRCIVSAGVGADGVPKTARTLLRAAEQYFLEMAVRNDLTRLFEQKKVAMADVEKACTLLSFAQNRLQVAALKFRDSTHLASWTAV